MKKNIIILACAIICSFSLKAQNLILNPSCDDTLIVGEIPHWKEITGTSWTRRCNDPDAFAGTCYFFCGAVKEAELEQTVSIAEDSLNIDNGNQKYAFSGYVRAYQQTPSDESDIYIQFYNAIDTLLTEYSFGPYTQTETWLKIDSVLLAPTEARKINIKLHTIRYNGSNNDGYFDELYLGKIATSGISDLNSDAFYSVYPNPSKGEIEILLKESSHESAVFILTDILGKKIKEIKIDSKITPLKLEVADGTYFVTIISDKNQYTSKIIVQQ